MPRAVRVTDPLSGEIRDGVIYGRGARDTKSLGIAHLAAFLALHRSGVALNRDGIFMATADEEAGGYFGAGWLVENRPELFQGRVIPVVDRYFRGLAASVPPSRRERYGDMESALGEPGVAARTYDAAWS